MSPNRISRCLVPVALVSLLAVGCSELPTQPVVENSASLEANQVTGHSADPSRLVPPAPQPGVTSNRARIQGQRGGIVVAGKFAVVIPPGAFSGMATVTVEVPDPMQPMVQLSIEPASKNNFSKPVTLVASLPNVDANVLMASGVSELTGGAWQMMAGVQPDPQQMTLRTPLQHFSTYRVELATAGQPTGGAGGTSSGGGTTPRDPSIQD
jgi:hypothetical protein